MSAAVIGVESAAVIGPGPLPVASVPPPRKHAVSTAAVGMGAALRGPVPALVARNGGARGGGVLRGGVLSGGDRHCSGGSRPRPLQLRP
jgi:hypothetical protein